MYYLRAKVKPSDPNNIAAKYSAVIFKGLFLAKDGKNKVRHEKIKALFEKVVMTALKGKNPTLEFEYSLKIEYNAKDFVLEEE